MFVTYEPVDSDMHLDGTQKINIIYTLKKMEIKNNHYSKRYVIFSGIRLDKTATLNFIVKLISTSRVVLYLFVLNFKTHFKRYIKIFFNY